MGQLAARTIYRGVFLPRVTYAAEIWANGIKLIKSQKKLLSAQRAPLLAMTGAYNTVSTNCLPVVAGTMPLDLEIMIHVLKRKQLNREITNEVHDVSVNDPFDEWQVLAKPKVDSARKLPSGDYLVVSTDTDTVKALKDIDGKSALQVTESGGKKPKVKIKNIPTEYTTDFITSSMFEQNQYPSNVTH